MVVKSAEYSKVTLNSRELSVPPTVTHVKMRPDQFSCLRQDTMSAQKHPHQISKILGVGAPSLPLSCLEKNLLISSNLGKD